ncbi:MAG TPA: tripartite tricarboxylate transporter substrate binding protein [Burkholderiales bacterium]|jgi:tripartite-type tricarboxylate transporter receptor subunit TctC|nr:tripartite tricarboxylate transporter substrate binding protein [Burkholderiales bacterium]
MKITPSRSPARLARLAMGIAAIALAAGSLSAGAQDAYPNHAIRLIAPQAPGGGVDLIGRILADRLGKALGQPVVIDNIAGAGGAIATETAARAPADGYTLEIGYVATHATNPAVKKVPYDAIKDFSPIGMIGGTPNLLIVRSSLPVKTVGEFVAYARAHAGEMNYGTSGKGTLNHLVMEQFKAAANFPSLSVPYRSIGQAFIDLMGGQVMSIFPGLAAGMPHVRSGAARPLAVTGARRHPILPDVPTFKELGYDDFEGLTWYGIVGPAKLPQPIVTKLNTEMNKILAAPDFKEKLSSEALDTMPMSPDQFGKYIAAEVAHWTKVARANKIQLTD